MENAVEALKMAFAVFVFAIAVALSFSVIGQVRATSDVIMALEDKTNDYDYVESTETNASNKERIVGFETILPAIYRYSEEQYAVTIVGTDGNAIARYDLETESTMNNWNEILKNKDRNGQIGADAKIAYNAVKAKLNNVETNIGLKDNAIFNQLSSIYEVENPNITATNNVYGAPWIGGADQKGRIMQRIKCDIDGSNCTINNIKYTGKNLNQYKGETFKEKFIEIQTSGTTITDTDKNGNIEYSLETVKGNKKLEIVYIMQ